MARPPRLGYGWPSSYDPVYLGSDDGRLIKATAILSTPMAVLSRGAKGNDRCIKADGRFIKANGRFIKRREKQCVKANGRFIKANGRFIKGRGNIILLRILCACRHGPKRREALGAAA